MLTVRKMHLRVLGHIERSGMRGKLESGDWTVIVGLNCQIYVKYNDKIEHVRHITQTNNRNKIPLRSKK